MAKSDGLDEQFERIQQQCSNFDQHERQFQDVLLELEGEESLEMFRKEYDTLHASFLKLHDGEKRLIRKCLDLQSDIHTCQTKIKTAEDLSAGDQSTIETLTKEIAKARLRLEQSKEKEAAAKENIKRLRLELKDLEKQVEKGVSGLVGHDSALQELGKVREDLQKERNTQRTQLIAIRNDIKDFQEVMTKLTKEKEKQHDQMKALDDVIQERIDLLGKERERKEYWEKELKVLKNELQNHHSQIKTNDSIIYQSQLAIQRLDEQLSEQRAATEKAIKEYEGINKKTQKFQQELEQEIDRSSGLKAANFTLQQQMKAKEQEVSGQKGEVNRLTKLRDAVLKKVQQLELSRSQVESERNQLRLELQKMEMEIASGRKASESDKKQIDDLTRERDILDKNYLGAQNTTQQQRDLLLVKDNQRKNLEQEIKGYERHAAKQMDLIYHLEQETAQYERDAAEAYAKFMKSQEEVKMLEAKVEESQRAIQESELKLKQQQGLFEQVLNERNLYSKSLLELNAEIQDMDRKYRIMSHSIGQLKEEIQAKEKDLVQHNIQKSKLEAEKKRYQFRKQKFVTMIDSNNRKIISLASEINKLNEIINEADTEKAKQRRDYENVMNERDILGAQLIKRNDELAKLYEKIRIQQSAMNKGDIQYQDRMVEIRQLSEKSILLRNELQTVKAFISKIEPLKAEINKRSKELMHERHKVKLLTDESQNPLNVHRWHKLEGSEPQTFETLEKIRRLQKQLIAKTEEVQEKEKLIAEREKLYVELKNILSRQPGPEVAEQLNVYQENLRKKTAQMKAMKASLKHFQDQVTRCQSQHTELNEELTRMKKDYFHERRAQKAESKRQAVVREMVGAAGTSDGSAAEPPTYQGHQVAPLTQLQDTAGTSVGSADDPYTFDVRAAAAAAAAEVMQTEDAGEGPEPIPPPNLSVGDGDGGEGDGGEGDDADGADDEAGTEAADEPADDGGREEAAEEEDFAAGPEGGDDHDTTPLPDDDGAGGAEDL